MGRRTLNWVFLILVPKEQELFLGFNYATSIDVLPVLQFCLDVKFAWDVHKFSQNEVEKIKDFGTGKMKLQF